VTGSNLSWLPDFPPCGSDRAGDLWKPAPRAPRTASFVSAIPAWTKTIWVLRYPLHGQALSLVTPTSYSRPPESPDPPPPASSAGIGRGRRPWESREKTFFLSKLMRPKPGCDSVPFTRRLQKWRLCPDSGQCGLGRQV
jgi:hypothetical protein